MAGITVKDPQGALNFDLPTATEILAVLPASFTVGDCFDWICINTGDSAAEIITITSAGTITFFGSIVINEPTADTPSSGHFRFRCTSTSTPAFDCYRIN